MFYYDSVHQEKPKHGMVLSYEFNKCVPILYAWLHADAIHIYEHVTCSWEICIDFWKVIFNPI